MIFILDAEGIRQDTDCIWWPMKRGSLKPWPNALDFSLYNARHACRVKCRESLANFLSEVASAIFCRVKFGQAQNCRALSSIVDNVWPQTIQIRALFPHNSLIIREGKLYTKDYS